MSSFPGGASGVCRDFRQDDRMAESSVHSVHPVKNRPQPLASAVMNTGTMRFHKKFLRVEFRGNFPGDVVDCIVRKGLL